jgi:hypothetical protein
MLIGNVVLNYEIRRNIMQGQTIALFHVAGYDT